MLIWQRHGQAESCYCITMIVCVCNNISERDIRRDPSLLDQCATECATCEDLVSELRLELSGVGGSNGKMG